MTENREYTFSKCDVYSIVEATDLKASPDFLGTVIGVFL
jgi:hypothetical protein